MAGGEAELEADADRGAEARGCGTGGGGARGTVLGFKQLRLRAPHWLKLRRGQDSIWKRLRPPAGPQGAPSLSLA
eukprot:7236933-Alexandrium_andersonii.AAC.1